MTATIASLKSNDPCWCGSGRKYKRCHKTMEGRVVPGHISPLRIVPPEIGRPSYADGPVARWSEPRVKSPEIIERMRRAGRAAAEILAAAGQQVAPGVLTDEIDAFVHEITIEKGGYPSPLNYGTNNPFPKSVCTSVNEVICHGIPDDRALVEGDIVNLDVTIYLDGVHGDCNATFAVGQIDAASQRLIDVTRECLEHAIEQVGPGRRFNLIGKAIEDHAHANKLGVVRDFVGHGIGEQFHTDLQIPHYYEPRLSTVMETGMTFTIEPMITMGSWQARVWDDGWTAVTVDGSRTAQFEHTVLVTDDGVDVLTRQP
ncbi:MAG: Methionine aminopeptidase [Acidimicrobiales bacterium]|nr:Methionine aminopeptidase [Acidimicrobiales bacterium]